MEQNLPIVTKKVWSLLRAMLLVIRKNISKQKLLLDLNMMIRRGKNAGKALQNLMFHHHHMTSFNRRQHASSPPKFTFPPDPQTELDDYYEFSCTNSPVTYYKNKSSHDQKNPTITNVVDPAMIKALEMLTSATASPALPGFGRTPKVRQLRITDSPFSLTNGEEDSYVDEAAEKFIVKFYNNLRRQS